MAVSVSFRCFVCCSLHWWKTTNSNSTIALLCFCYHPDRFDARGKPLSMGRRWSEVVSFGLRADFRFSLHGQIPSKGHLIINGTTLADEGIYRCRVDFKNSPARHFRVQLNVTGECRFLSHFSRFTAEIIDLKNVGASPLKTTRNNRSPYIRLHDFKRCMR